jgi:phenylacetate-coenzyme A ligase PaaK-like adenylate-forming protein
VNNEIDCLVGIPTQVLGLAGDENADTIPAGLIKSVLLSADYAPAALVDELRRAWQCRVFGHYGSTEMGFGGGVECEAFAGYHLREADLLFEIVDPASGRSLPDGELGEIVFTTLPREAMPLIRYRTGDLSRFLPHACPCGTMLRRLEKVRGKVHDMVSLRTGDWLSIVDLDEVLFALPGIVNYKALLIRAGDADRFELVIHPGSRGHRPQSEEIVEAVTRISSLAGAVEAGRLILQPIQFSDDDWITTGVVKRAIVQRYDRE